MNLSKKLPGFTLMEVTIAMLIAAIAIAITFTAYRIVSGSYFSFNKKQEKVATLTTIDKLLKQDFIKARSIIRTSDGIFLELNGGIVTYSFKDSYILRDQFSLAIDTFKLQVNDLNCSFENDKVEEGKEVDLLSFRTQLDGDIIPFQYLKIYSAQDLF
nr:prepilin-type N-terminal cleavage/methylation domain-containing protein [Pedobacter panaciterrae]